MFSSWCPFSSLVAGVKIGSGRRSDSRIPFGRGMPHTSPFSRYSAHPDPERYPRTTHSIGNGFAFRHSIARPRSVSACALAAGGKVSTSMEIMWLGTMSESMRNQNAEIWVSTFPFPGIPSGITTSNAESRSEATRSSFPSTS